MDDWQLLRQFIDKNSQEAFATLTARYLGLVYSVCRRELTDSETAEDVTQAVFLILARKAPSLRRSVILSGWLFQTARFAAKNARLQAQRRTAYEQKAAEVMQQQTQTEDAAWAEIEPLLNRSLAALKAGERECVLLRFFQELSFAETGAALGLTEEAARKCLTRALEKMRRFFGKEGVIVPGVALAALLSAHAAKAFPATTGTIAGYLNLSLTSSHVCQLSEGVLKAMKIAQIKTALGLTAVGIAFCTYAIAIGVIHSPFLPIRSLPAVPKPGHILIQPPGKIMTAAQIAGRCREAYAALTSYQGNSNVTTQSVSTQFPLVLESHTAASIQFMPLGKIHVAGQAEHGGGTFAYISNGNTTEETHLGPNNWKKIDTTEDAVAGVTGIALNAATTIPAALLNINWGNPLAVGKSLDPEVREDIADGQACYVLTSHSTSPTRTETVYLWVDEKSFLLRRLVTGRRSAAQSKESASNPIDLPAMQTHMDEQFTNIRLNAPIPDSAFTLPPTS